MNEPSHCCWARKKETGAAQGWRLKLIIQRIILFLLDQSNIEKCVFLIEFNELDIDKVNIVREKNNVAQIL